MLDEIINYVQSLQRQVELLSQLLLCSRSVIIFMRSNNLSYTGMSLFSFIFFEKNINRPFVLQYLSRLFALQFLLRPFALHFHAWSMDKI